MRTPAEESFDERRRIVRSALFFVIALFATGVATAAASFTGASDEPSRRYAPTAADRALPPIAAGGPGPMIALTFDDGPSPQLTPFILDVLAAKRVRATFFVQGDNVAEHPELVRRMQDEGHVVANHAWDHPWFPDLTDDEALEQVERTNEEIVDATGTAPTLFRYPFGEPSDGGDAALARMGLHGGIHWRWLSREPGDFQCPGAGAVARYVITEAVDQAIILLHDAGDVVDCGPEQLDYLPQAIDLLRARGFTFGVVAPAAVPSPVNQDTLATVVAR